MYADDKQLYSATTVTNIDTTHECLANCILNILNGVPLDDYS